MDATPTAKNTLFRFAFSKITVTVLIALLCACLIISLANDLFAFVKPTNSLTLEISQPISSTELSRLLQNEGIIENAFAFWIYARLKNAESRLREFRGSAHLSSDMGYRDILDQFK